MALLESVGAASLTGELQDRKTENIILFPTHIFLMEIINVTFCYSAAISEIIQLARNIDGRGY